MHAEDLLAQIAGRALCEQLVERCRREFGEESEERNFAEKGLQSMVRHLRVIERLGRFPARNAALGRESTEEEKGFLEENKHGL